LLNFFLKNLQNKKHTHFNPHTRYIFCAANAADAVAGCFKEAAVMSSTKSIEPP